MSKKSEARVMYATRIPAIIQRLPELVAKWVTRQTSFIERLARQYAPIVTGNLASSSKSYITIQSSSTVEGEVSFNAAYAAYVNFGTGRAGAGSAVPERPSTVRYSRDIAGSKAKPYLSLASVQGFRQLQAATRDLEEFIGAVR